jgi:hypothetical protein
VQAEGKTDFSFSHQRFTHLKLVPENAGLRRLGKREQEESNSLLT